MIQKLMTEPQFMMVGIGLLFSFVALLLLLVSELRKKHGLPPVPQPAAAQQGRNTTWWLLLSLIIVAGALLRFYEIDVKTISHPEAYTPNIDLPPAISTPPPRHGFVETLKWHFFDEPHPVGFYMGMWVWTKIFGTSILSMRIVPAIFGILSILLIYLLASKTYNRRVGMVAAIILAMHGFHIYWSQIARMYVPGCFFGLLSTWLLIRIYETGKPDLRLEAGYVLTVLAGVSTQIFFWPFLGIQLLWVLIKYSKDCGICKRVSYMQTLAIILGAPMWSHIVLMTRQHYADTPTLDFLMSFFSFGFALKTTDRYEMVKHAPTAVIVIVFVISIVLLVVGLSQKTNHQESRRNGVAVPSYSLLLLLAVGIALIMYAISYASIRRVEALRITSIVPLVALLLPWVTARIGPVIHAWLSTGKSAWANNLLINNPVPLLAIVPTTALFLVSFWISVIAPRAFLVFIPYLVIVLSMGIVAISRTRIIGVVTGTLVAILLIYSFTHFKEMSTSPRDYKELASLVSSRQQSGDMIFAQRNDWCTTPLFYYLDNQRIVADNFMEYIRKNPRSRIWVIDFDCHDFAAVQGKKLLAMGYKVIDEVTTTRAGSKLYTPPDTHK